MRRRGSRTPTALELKVLAGSEGTAIQLVDDTELGEIHARPSLGVYFKQLWQRRHYILKDARGKALQSERDLWLGRIWIILRPLLDALLYGFMFGYILKTARGIENFAGFLLLGITFYSIVSKALMSGTTLIRSNRGMLIFPFPRAALVVSQSLRHVLDSLPNVIIAVVVALALQWEKPLAWTIIFLPILFVLLHMFAAGIIFLTARLCVHLPDMRFVISVGQRALFFISGIFFSVERFVDQPVVLAVMTANPVYQFLTAIRDVTLYATVPDLGVWAYLLLWSTLTLAIGFVYFWSAEEKYANVRS
ncbi:ABC transporter permease [Corynebacterium cystitidis]|uniref:ABC transporter permease n=1 Tax=Corynebacterium cystitidis TaxID=35757 RepID=UPI00211F23C1|nr:ABC transporter permease [Corynebacterium cystitidis]